MAMDPLGVLASGILVTEFNDITGYVNKTSEMTGITQDACNAESTQVWVIQRSG